MPKPLFIYTKKLSPSKLKQIEAAGFVCLQVESFDDYKIISDKPLQTNERMIFECALAAIGKAATDPTMFAKELRSVFYGLIAKRTLEANKL